MRFGSVCSGIEAASAAWLPLGWRSTFMSEIEAFPRAVLKHHYPDVPLHGDFTSIKAGEYEPIDVLVGGTPCQSFSVAGLRGGMADVRGNLALQYLRLADRLRPEWVVWENVPGVLSSNGGRDFGSFLGGLVELGYGFAYRVLVAQFFGLAQRRMRVFVVGCIGDWRRAAAVLFEPASLRGHPAPRRKAGERVADSLTVGANQCSGTKSDFVEVARPLGAKRDGGGRGDLDNDTYVSMSLNAHGGSGRMDGESETFVCGDTAAAITADQRHGHQVDQNRGTLITHSLRADGFDASEDGTGRGTPLVAFAQNQRDEVRQMDVAGALAGEPGMKQQTYVQTSAVRRLTPRECERLQGFPDDFTLIPWRGGMAPDGPRYRALGNSMAVPVMRWIGQRIGAAG